MGLDGIMLSEINKRQINTIPYHLYVECKKAELVKTESRLVATIGWGWGTGQMFKATNWKLAYKYVLQL